MYRYEYRLVLTPFGYQWQLVRVLVPVFFFTPVITVGQQHQQFLP